MTEKMTPAAVELAIEIRREVEARCEESDQLRCRAVERAQIEADLAQRRFMLVDPLCNVRSYVTSGCEGLCWRSSSTVPGTHNYSDFRKAMRPAS